MDEDDYHKMTSDRLKTELLDTLREYEDWIAKEIPFNLSWDPEVFHLVQLRDDVHEIMDCLEDRNISFDKKRVEILDTHWKTHIKRSKDQGYHFTFRRDDQPKSKWWWWLDS